jgi:hypothetical protein
MSEDNTEENLPQTCDIHSTQLSHTNEFILNCFLHVSILFAFLNILFYYIIAPLATNEFKGQISEKINELIDTEIPTPIDLRTKKNTTSDTNTSTATNALSNLLNQNASSIAQTPLGQSLNLHTIQQIQELASSSGNLEQLMDNYITEYSSPNSIISLHNSDIFSYGIYLSLILFIITFLLVIFIKYSCSSCIHLVKLFLENIITFIFVGVVEFWFFMNYAKNFNPAPPSLLTNTAIDNIKSYLQ